MLNLAKPIKQDPDLLALKELEKTMLHRKQSSGIKGYVKYRMSFPIQNY